MLGPGIEVSTCTPCACSRCSHGVTNQTERSHAGGALFVMCQECVKMRQDASRCVKKCQTTLWTCTPTVFALQAHNFSLPPTWSPYLQRVAAMGCVRAAYGSRSRASCRCSCSPASWSLRQQVGDPAGRVAGSNSRLKTPAPSQPILAGRRAPAARRAPPAARRAPQPAPAQAAQATSTRAVPGSGSRAQACRAGQGERPGPG